MEEGIQRLVAEVQLRTKPWRYDAEIGGACRQNLGLELRQKECSLERWIPDPTVPAPQCEARAPKKKGKIDWDQFQTNEQLFGYVSTFHFDLYSTPLNIALVSPQMQATAESIARDINNGNKRNE